MRVIYVDARNIHGEHTGKSWATAFDDLQDALDIWNPQIYSAIWVARGTYIPSKTYAPNGIPGGAYGAENPTVPIVSQSWTTFNLPTDVVILGGFRGTESRAEKRNPWSNPTILSGAYNSYHVVFLGNDVAQTGVTATLDGVTVAHGNANGPVDTESAGMGNTILAPFTFDHSNGAGILAAFGSTLKLKNFNLHSNVAQGIGGGLYANNSNVIYAHGRARDNFSGQQGGGLAIYNTWEDTAHISLVYKVRLHDNVTLYFGGGIVVEGTQQDPGSKFTIRRCKVNNNTSQEAGGVCVDSLEADIVDCDFEANEAAVNGGAVCTTNIVGTISAANTGIPLVKRLTSIRRCRFVNNIALANEQLRENMLEGSFSYGLGFPIGGGAVVCYLNGLLDVVDSEFLDNESLADGGAIMNGSAATFNFVFGAPVPDTYAVTTNVRNCKFIRNKAHRNGGAIASESSTLFVDQGQVIPASATVLTVTESCFCKNEAVLGGAIYVNNSEADITEDNIFKCNQAEQGRDIYIVEPSD